MLVEGKLGTLTHAESLIIVKVDLGCDLDSEAVLLVQSAVLVLAVVVKGHTGKSALILTCRLTLINTPALEGE